jgi:hypothetical protein
VAGATFRVLDSLQVLRSPRTFRWLAGLLAVLLFVSGTVVAFHLHKDTRDCSLCIVSHSPAALTSPAVAEVPERIAFPAPAADPIARTADLTQTHVIRPPPVVA